MSFFKKLLGKFREEVPTEVKVEEVLQEAVNEEKVEPVLEDSVNEEKEAVQLQEEVSLEDTLEKKVAILEASEGYATPKELEAALVEEMEALDLLDDLEENQALEEAMETEEIEMLERLEDLDESQVLEEVLEAEEVSVLEAFDGKEEDLEEVETPVHEANIDDMETTDEAEEIAIELPISEETLEVEVPKVEKKKGFFSKLVEGLAKTRDQFVGTVEDVLKGFKKIDEDLYEELEEVLIMADFGVDTTLAIMDRLRQMVKDRKLTEPEQLKDALKEVITQILTSQEVTPIIEEGKQNVILVIGVNGVGKTTTIGKLSNQFKQDGKKVVLAAADTFRAAAIEQLAVWANRAEVDLIKHDEGTDPAAVVFDGIQAAKARKADILICDTAGRLQNKTNLMKELEKIGRIIDREYPDAHKEVLIVLDATTGQNAISQVKVFKEVAKVDGIILTKLDGTAKGGAVVGICESLQVPVKYIGVGEKIDDLQVFDPQAFADALFVKSEK